MTCLRFGNALTLPTSESPGYIESSSGINFFTKSARVVPSWSTSQVGEKSNPLAPESFKAYASASQFSFSANVTTDTPAFEAPIVETRTSAELS